MREVWLILRREFMERVGSRAFLIGTILFPLTIALLIFLPSAFDGPETRSFVLLDETGAGVGGAVAARLDRPGPAGPAGRYEVEVVPGSADVVGTELAARLAARDIDGYVVIPADVVTGGRIRYRFTDPPGPALVGEIQIAASEFVRGERLRQAGIDPATIAEVVQPVGMLDARDGSAEGSDAPDDDRSGFMIGYALSFLIYFMVIFYGVFVMRSVLEEKTSRIAEVLVSSVRSTSLMAGKIFGVASVAILQVLIWTVLIALLVTRSEWVATRLGLDPDMLSSIPIEPTAVALAVAYFVLGFFLYASLYAALGAAVTSEQEAQSFQMLLVLPLIVPIVAFPGFAGEPLGPVATFLGLFPLTAPVTMPMRLAAAAIPAWQVAASLATMAIALGAAAWIAGKIFRVGILATGKRPGLRELVRWVRMA